MPPRVELEMEKAIFEVEKVKVDLERLYIGKHQIILLLLYC